MILTARTSGIVAAFALLASSCGQSATGDSSDITAPETAYSRADVEAIIRAYLLENPELIVEVLQVLEQRDKDTLAQTLASDPRDATIGADNAPITIVEFFDYNCGFCKRSVDWLVETVENSDGKIRAVFKELPILNEQSLEASTAALAAAKQNKYMELHLALMAAPANSLTSSRIDEIADGVGINVTKMRKAMESDEILAHIQSVRNEAIEQEATATPAFFVNGEYVRGFNRQELERIIGEFLEVES